jgi:hypothetical protein
MKRGGFDPLFAVGHQWHYVKGTGANLLPGSGGDMLIVAAGQVSFLGAPRLPGIAHEITSPFGRARTLFRERC